MKISKSRLKEIIKEEVESNKALISAIESLSGKIDSLDVFKIQGDYLSYDLRK